MNAPQAQSEPPAPQVPALGPPPAPRSPPRTAPPSISAERNNSVQKPTQKESTTALLRRVKIMDELRRRQLNKVMEGGIRKGEEQKAAAKAKKAHLLEMLKKRELATFPVNLKVEHCTVERGPDNKLRPGPVKSSFTNEKLSISTFHYPFNGEDSIEADSFETLCSTSKRIYELSYKDTMHRGHDHPSEKDGDIIMGDVRLQLGSADSGRKLTAQSWNEALALITCQQLQLSHGGKILGKMRLATITASFTCPRSR